MSKISKTGLYKLNSFDSYFFEMPYTVTPFKRVIAVI